MILILLCSKFIAIRVRTNNFSIKRFDEVIAKIKPCSFLRHSVYNNWKLGLHPSLIVQSTEVRKFLRYYRVRPDASGRGNNDRSVAVMR